MDVARFRPSRTQRRVLRRGEPIALEIGPPAYRDEKYEIYRRHKERFGGAGPSRGESPDAFRKSFYEAGNFTRECVYRLEGRIVAISFLDLTRRAASSIYCCFDPEFARWSPGTLSILREIAQARELGIPYYYLGYWVHENRSLRYKADFRPCEAFDGRNWIPLRGPDGAMLLDPAATRTERFEPLLPRENAVGEERLSQGLGGG